MMRRVLLVPAIAAVLAVAPPAWAQSPFPTYQRAAAEHFCPA